MKANISPTDKAIRVLSAAIIAILYYYDIISGLLAYLLMGIAIILLITSLLNFCPVYKILNINTCKTKQ